MQSHVPSTLPPVVVLIRERRETHTTAEIKWIKLDSLTIRLPLNINSLRCGFIVVVASRKCVSSVAPSTTFHACVCRSHAYARLYFIGWPPKSPTANHGRAEACQLHTQSCRRFLFQVVVGRFHAFFSGALTKLCSAAITCCWL